MAVFGYQNPKAPLTTDNEFDRLIALFAEANCPNIAKFIEVVRFGEKVNKVAMSYNLSLAPRSFDTSREPTLKDVAQLFSQQDILVGTRRGIEGAAVWFKNFSGAIEGAEPAKVQFMDKIFGEALESFSSPAITATFADMAEFALGGDAPQPDTESKQ